MFVRIIEDVSCKKGIVTNKNSVRFCVHFVHKFCETFHGHACTFVGSNFPPVILSSHLQVGSIRLLRMASFTRMRDKSNKRWRSAVKVVGIVLPLLGTYLFNNNKISTKKINFEKPPELFVKIVEDVSCIK